MCIVDNIQNISDLPILNARVNGDNVKIHSDMQKWQSLRTLECRLNEQQTGSLFLKELCISFVAWERCPYELTLNVTAKMDLSPLAHLVFLRRLELARIETLPTIMSIDTLVSLPPNLSCLSVRGKFSIPAFPSNLKALSLRFTIKGDLAPVAFPKNLTKLHLGTRSITQDMKWDSKLSGLILENGQFLLEDCSQLQELHYIGRRPFDINTPWHKFTSLTELIIPRIVINSLWKCFPPQLKTLEVSDILECAVNLVPSGLTKLVVHADGSLLPSIAPFQSLEYVQWTPQYSQNPFGCALLPLSLREIRTNAEVLRSLDSRFRITAVSIFYGESRRPTFRNKEIMKAAKWVKKQCETSWQSIGFEKLDTSGECVYQRCDCFSQQELLSMLLPGQHVVQTYLPCLRLIRHFPHVITFELIEFQCIICSGFTRYAIGELFRLRSCTVCLHAICSSCAIDHDRCRFCARMHQKNAVQSPKI